MSSAEVAWSVATSALLLACGSRTALDDTPAQGQSSTDAAAPEDASLPSFDAPLLDAAACMPAPPGGTVIAGFPETAISVGLAVAAGSLYVGTSSLSSSSPLDTGAIARVASGGGPTQPVTAPQYNFGNLASDGARVYYPESTGAADGPNGAIYELLGIAAIDVATGAVHPVPSTVPPWAASSLDTAYMIAAAPGTPGVFWIGGTSGSDSANSLSVWSPQTDAVTLLAKGQRLSGLAADDSGVYWADTGGGQGITVYRIAAGGDMPIMLANVPGGTYGVLLGVSSNDVVFVSDYMTGAIEVVSKSGGPVRRLVTAAAAWVNDAAWVDDPYLYWTEDATQSKLSRIPVAGGATEVVPTQGDIQSLAFDACNIYIASTNTTQVLVRPK